MNQRNIPPILTNDGLFNFMVAGLRADLAIIKAQADPEPEEADEAEEESDEGYCPNCNGSGEGMYDGTRCSSCGGSGEIHSGPSKEDYDSDRADYYNDNREDR